MKNLNIEINNSRILGFRVEMLDDMPRVTATIGLFCGERKVSEFSASTENYYGTTKIDVTPKIIAGILKTSEELERIVTIACSSAIGALPAHMEF